MAGHVSSRKNYYLVFGALMVLTIATVLVAEVNLGPLNDIVAMAIAVTKAVLVILIFMHVKDSSVLTKITVVAGFFWLLIMISLTLVDYLTRGWLDTFSAAR
jgi:cytochrome c oxidase subunit IV